MRTNEETPSKSVVLHNTIAEQLSIPSISFTDTIQDRLESPLEILYQDDVLIAVNKPAGLLVHRGSLTDSHEPVLLQTLRDQIGKRVYPVHRLDQPTSGVILFALTPTSAACLVKQFTQRQVKKYYQALVRGWTHHQGTIKIPLMESFDADWSASKRLSPTLQSAQSDYTTIRWFEPPWLLNPFEPNRYSLIEVFPKTGRSHQIRRHLKHIAHPIIGDARYGDIRCNRLFETQCQLPRMLLTAKMIQFIHPTSGTLTSINAPRGDSFDHVLSKLCPYEVTIDERLLPAQIQSQIIETAD